MRKILFLSDPNGNVSIPCPEGSRVKILTALIAPNSLAEGDQILLTMARSNVNVCVAATRSLPTITSNISMFIGAAQNEARIGNIDPVTGGVAYEQLLNTATAPLPDVWWPFDISLTVSANAKNLAVTYEQDDPEPKKITSRKS